MKRVTRQVRVTGPAPPDVAWERYVHPHRWADWAPQIRGVDLERGTDETRRGVIAPGLRGRVRGPLGLTVPFHVDDVDADRRSWTWTVTLARLAVTMRHGLLPAPDGQTIADLTLEGPPPIVAGYAPIAALALRALVR